MTVDQFPFTAQALEHLGYADAHLSRLILSLDVRKGDLEPSPEGKIAADPPLKDVKSITATGPEGSRLPGERIRHGGRIGKSFTARTVETGEALLWEEGNNGCGVTVDKGGRCGSALLKELFEFTHAHSGVLPALIAQFTAGRRRYPMPCGARLPRVTSFSVRSSPVEIPNNSP
jgi:hypothetical protein